VHSAPISRKGIAMTMSNLAVPHLNESRSTRTQTTTSEQPYCLVLAAIDQQPVGGKAAGLAELVKLGLPVPAAFAIVHASTSVFPEELERYYQELGAGNVAVRSSALGEDSAEASFAGQFDTLLNIKGIDQLHAAITDCVNSLHSAWAEAYTAEQLAASSVALPSEGSISLPQMCVVVQQMVQPRVAGVLFTADPVSGRHDRLVIDAVQGLGEALMSGTETPDHYELSPDNQIVQQEWVTEQPLLQTTELTQLANTARDCAEALGYPLDMEWAIDQDGQILWLQARPITTLGTDLSELDTPLDPDQVVTRCNIGEMMPGAVSPLTFSVQGRGIEHGMQHMHVSWGARKAITQDWTQITQSSGHLFINMSGSLAAARLVAFSSADSIAQSLCGRPIPELQEPGDKAPWWRRQFGSLVFLRYCQGARRATTEFETRFKAMHLRYADDAPSMMAELDRQGRWIGDTHEVHLRSSTYAAVMEGIVQRIVAGSGAPPSTAAQAEAARLLAGAQYVESALLVEQLDEVVDQIACHHDAQSAFGDTTPAAALAWLRSSSAGAAQARFRDFLQQHGHRGFRELCLRQRGWADEPEQLIVTMQATLASRFTATYAPKIPPKIDLQTLPRSLRFMLPRAHDAIRQREHTKSLLVEVTHRLKRGYRHLGELLAQNGDLADPDLVFFFTLQELNAFCAEPTPSAAQRALKRRKALAFQEQLYFDEIYVGKAQPRQRQASASAHDGQLTGRPVSRGVVEGVARVCLNLQQAAALQPGDILVAPVTDVGWTPYFSLIAGLATDIGSAVSHGAVIAREYGLPAIVNLRNATQLLHSGDFIRLDADSGVLTVLQTHAQ
jgi:phosphohistidine swiveling domain-containing protein